MRLPTVSTVTAPPGSGKTYSRVRWLLEEWLPNGEGVFFTNLPLDVAAIAEYAARKTKVEPNAIEARIRLLDQGVEKLWMRDLTEGGSGPWEYFESVPLDGARIVIDEAHLFCGPSFSEAHKEAWANWCKELRHRKGSSVELIDQDTSGICKEVTSVGETRKILTNGETDRDPWFRITLADWYELVAAFTRSYVPTIIENEERKVAGKWKSCHRRKWRRDPEFFRFYDSYSAPKEGQAQGGAPETPHQFQKRSVVGVVRWFLWRNCFAVGCRAAIVGAVVWAS
ncbi:MAG: zonular occludens toxin domain-containing protein, partial [Planctomycetota bacterium]|nr:zonular occludens toxin domain-containing protein [Planctomycetota bacterium]